MIAVLSFGANLGAAADTVESAISSLGSAVIARSGLYRTAPVGGPDQDDFVNAVAVVEVESAAAGLEVARGLETAAGRVRDVRWGPRSLDVDVIVVRDGSREILSADAELTLPHPRAHERRFVLRPWLDVEPDAVLPGQGRISDLLAELDGQEVTPL